MENKFVINNTSLFNQKSGISLHKYEMDELIDQMDQADLEDESDNINYKWALVFTLHIYSLNLLVILFE